MRHWSAESAVEDELAKLMAELGYACTSSANALASLIQQSLGALDARAVANALCMMTRTFKSLAVSDLASSAGAGPAGDADGTGGLASYRAFALAMGITPPVRPHNHNVPL